MGALERRLRAFAVVWLDVLAYAVTVMALVTVAALALGIATGGGFVRGKVLLFVTGWLIVAFATVRLWPASPEDLESSASGDGRSVPEHVGGTRIQSLARALPPVRWMRQPEPEERVSPGGKLFVAGCAVLLASFLMETVFGVV